MRQLMYSALQADTDLVSEMPAPPGEPGPVRIYEHNVLGTHGIPPLPEFPFAVIVEQPSRGSRVDAAQKSTTRTFQLYVYDELGSTYKRIERIILRARDTLLACVATWSPSGAWCQDVKYLGMSVDSRDPEYLANMRFGTFAFVASQ